MRVHKRRRRALMAIVAGSTALIAGQIGFEAAARADAPVLPGTAAANAAVIGVVPQASSLSLTSSAGQSESAYNQTEDQATSATIDTGGLGVLLENSPVCGQVFFTQQRQPQPLTADSQDGSRTLNDNHMGNETVTVSSSPEYARAVTAPVSQQIPGVLQLTGQSDTEVRYTAGTEQEADASVHADVTLLGGLVSMHGMEWQAHLESGVKHSSSATFSPGSVTLAPGGLPVTLPSSDSASQVFAAINSVLATFGVTVQPPATMSNPDQGSLSISPLDLHFSGSPADNAALSPAAAQIPSVEQLLAAQTSDGSDCSQIKNFLGNLLTPSFEVTNLALAAGQGAGGLDVDLGGATVSTRSLPQYANPFGSANPFAGGAGFSSATPLPGGAASPGSVGSGAGGSPVPPSSPFSAGTAGTGTTGAPGTPGDAGSPGAPASARGGPAGTGRATPASSASSPSSTALIRCVTTSPAGGGCWRGLGAVAGAGALAVGLGLLAADLGVAALPGRRRSAKRRNRRAAS